MWSPQNIMIQPLGTINIHNKYPIRQKMKKIQRKYTEWAQRDILCC